MFKNIPCICSRQRGDHNEDVRENEPERSARAPRPSAEECVAPRSIADGAKHLVAFLRDAIQAHRTPIPAAPSIIQRLILDNADHHSPFRELATARQRICRPHGPYASADLCHTRKGVFSILVYRGIVFNSSAFRNLPEDELQLTFESYADWETYINKMQAHHPNRGDSFWCNPKAYGRNQGKNRNLELAKSYWLYSATVEWRTQSAIIDIAKKLSKAAEAKQIGLLIGYMIAADLAYTGVVEMPEPEEIGKMVGQLMKGGASGLWYLGLSPLEKATGDAFMDFLQNQFVALYHAVDELLTAAEKEEMGWNPIVLEHALCKFKRAVKDGYPTLKV